MLRQNISWFRQSSCSSSSSSKTDTACAENPKLSFSRPVPPRNHTALSGHVSGTNCVPTAQLVLGFLPESREFLRSGKTTRTLPSGMISKAEEAYLTEGIRQDVRGDGRSCSGYRPLKLELGVLPQASGSSRCQLGATDVLVGVKVRSEPKRGSSVYMSCTSCQHCSYAGWLYPW